MKKRNYIISAHGVIERDNLYRYLHNKGYKDHILNTKEDIIYDTWPIFISMKHKEIGVLRSATICYLMSKSGDYKTVEEIMEMLGEN